MISKLAREMKIIETALVEATFQVNFTSSTSPLKLFIFQAQKKLKSIQKAQESKVNSDEVVRLSHLISRSYSVAAPFT
jgi:hypothetical protein